MEVATEVPLVLLNMWMASRLPRLLLPAVGVEVPLFLLPWLPLWLLLAVGVEVPLLVLQRELRVLLLFQWASAQTAAVALWV